MKFDINKMREVYPQRIGESDKEFKQKCLNLFVNEIITDLELIRDFNDFDISKELNYKEKKGKITIEFKLRQWN